MLENRRECTTNDETVKVDCLFVNQIYNYYEEDKKSNFKTR